MPFVQTITKSIYGPEFYREKITSGVTGGWKYFFLLILCLSVLYTLIGGALAWRAYTAAEKSGELRSQILAWYPQELAITLKNGEVSTNVEEPYIVPMPSTPNDKVDQKQARPPKNLIVIDTGNPIAPADFDRYDTAIIIGKTDIGWRDAEKGKIEIQSLSALKEFSYVLNHESLAGLLDIALKFLKVLIIVALIFMPFIIFAGLSVRYLAYLLIGALVIWGVAAIRNVKLTYGQSYRLGLFLITLPIGYNLLISDWSAPGLRVPFLFTVLLAVVTWINLPKKSPEVTGAAPATPAPQAPLPATPVDEKTPAITG